MPETAWTTVPTTSPSSATWPSISSARSPPKAPCASRSSGQDGRTRSSPKSSPKSEMRLPCRDAFLEFCRPRIERRDVRVDRFDRFECCLLQQLGNLVVRTGEMRGPHLVLPVADPDAQHHGGGIGV